ncbi:hypothetical protein CCAN12_10002 [Capnocytophaga canimorsus]|uniref:Uncharacterized protein n=1 Tax=Capnocytophaga canimorsus TaxID=28188 RepID=A0A0B7H538_9FLAO|nr:hypothetical protein CCAN12_10002 [Capnocytophaga canimorsus]
MLWPTELYRLLHQKHPHYLDISNGLQMYTKNLCYKFFKFLIKQRFLYSFQRKLFPIAVLHYSFGRLLSCFVLLILSKL